MLRDVCSPSCSSQTEVSSRDWEECFGCASEQPISNRDNQTHLIRSVLKPSKSDFARGRKKTGNVHGFPLDTSRPSTLSTRQGSLGVKGRHHATRRPRKSSTSTSLQTGELYVLRSCCRPRRNESSSRFGQATSTPEFLPSPSFLASFKMSCVDRMSSSASAFDARSSVCIFQEFAVRPVGPPFTSGGPSGASKTCEPSWQSRRRRAANGFQPAQTHTHLSPPLQIQGMSNRSKHSATPRRLTQSLGR